MQKVKAYIKTLVLYLFEYMGINALLRSTLKTPVVFFFHGVAKKRHPICEGESFPLDLFRNQISFIKKKFDVVSIEQFHERFVGKSFRNNEALITFDDGYENNLIIAAPLLKEYDIPFTVFVSAMNIDSQKTFYITIPRIVIVGGELNEVNIPTMGIHQFLNNENERITFAYYVEYYVKYLSHKEANLIAEEIKSNVSVEKFHRLLQTFSANDLLNWEEIKKLESDYNCTIGSHTMDHCICHNKQSLKEIEWQISESKKLIENKTGHPCKYFCYPNGDFTDESNDIVRRHYELGFSTEIEPIVPGITDSACVGRIGVPTSLLELKFLISKLALRQLLK